MKLNTMKVRHILRHEQSRQSFSGCSVCVVCGDYPDHLWASVCTEDDRSAAYAVYCYAVHEVGVSAVQVRADGSSEEAGKKWRCDVGESDPRNVRSDIDSSLSWEEWKRLLGKLKFPVREDDDRRVSRPVKVKIPIDSLKEYLRRRIRMNDPYGLLPFVSIIDNMGVSRNPH